MSGRMGAAGAVVMLFLIAACTGSADPPAGTPPPTSAPATTVATTPTTSVVETSDGAPPLPDAAKQQTPDGAEAFVRYWFELLNMAYATGDTHPFRTAAVDTCLTCDALAGTIEDVVARGNKIEGGQIAVTVVDSAPLDTQGDALITAKFGATDLLEVADNGDLIAVIEPDTGDVTYAIDVLWIQGGWGLGAARLVVG